MPELRSGKGGDTMQKRTGNKKPAFGGYAISFQGRTDSLESLFGAEPIGPAEMTKKLWSYVERKGLATMRCPDQAEPGGASACRPALDTSALRHRVPRFDHRAQRRSRV